MSIIIRPRARLEDKQCPSCKTYNNFEADLNKDIKWYASRLIMSKITTKKILALTAPHFSEFLQSSQEGALLK